jgi:hypothetical protein
VLYLVHVESGAGNMLVLHEVLQNGLRDMVVKTYCNASDLVVHLSKKNYRLLLQEMVEQVHGALREKYRKQLNFDPEPGYSVMSFLGMSIVVSPHIPNNQVVLVNTRSHVSDPTGKVVLNFKVPDRFVLNDDFRITEE